jgi:acetoacetate decarboxylase
MLPSNRETIVTASFGYYNGVDFLAGGSYRIATISVEAKFDGKKDHVKGDYILVIFEDETIPIIGGREQIGAPKIYGDISSVKIMSDDSLRCENSL